MSSLLRDKKALESKKFLAFLIAEISWKIILIVGLIVWRDAIGMGPWWIMLSIILTSGFLEVAFIAGQAALDRYVRVAEIAAEQFQNTLEGDSKPPKQE